MNLHNAQFIRLAVQFLPSPFQCVTHEKYCASPLRGVFSPLLFLWRKLSSLNNSDKLLGKMGETESGEKCFHAKPVLMTCPAVTLCCRKLQYTTYRLDIKEVKENLGV
jgi:hypothetical protein